MNEDKFYVYVKDPSNTLFKWLIYSRGCSFDAAVEFACALSVDHPQMDWMVSRSAEEEPVWLLCSTIPAG